MSFVRFPGNIYKVILIFIGLQRVFLNRLLIMRRVCIRLKYYQGQIIVLIGS